MLTALYLYQCEHVSPGLYLCEHVSLGLCLCAHDVRMRMCASLRVFILVCELA
jgi:hypothetical protein